MTRRAYARRRNALLLALSASFGLCGVGDAQTGTLIHPRAPGYIPDRIDLSQEDRGRLGMYSVAACLIKERRRQVERFLAVSPLDDKVEAPAGALANAGCLDGGQLSMKPIAMRGAIFVAAYRREHPSTPVISGSSAPWKFNAAQEFSGYQSFGECVVRASPDDAAALVLAPVGSQAESVALRAVVPRMSACLASGSTVRFNKTMLSGILAEALYRLSIPSPALISDVR